MCSCVSFFSFSNYQCCTINIYFCFLYFLIFAVILSNEYISSHPQSTYMLEATTVLIWRSICTLKGFRMQKFTISYLFKYGLFAPCMYVQFRDFLLVLGTFPKIYLQMGATHNPYPVIHHLISDSELLFFFFLVPCINYT